MPVAPTIAPHGVQFNNCNSIVGKYWTAPHHGPTLFLHGTQDNIVPPSTSEMYFDKLQGLRSTKTKRVVGRTDHAWLSTAPADILAWLESEGR